jgi:hypothetical protein
MCIPDRVLPVFLAVLVSLSCLSAADVLAVEWTQQAVITSPGGAAFGRSVSLSGDTGIVGAYAFAGGGAAYVVQRSGENWSQVGQLLADDRVEGDEFGRAVAIQGDVALIGAPADHEEGIWAGTAYVFQRTAEGWSQMAKILPEYSGALDFGISVAIDGHTAIIGAEGARTGQAMDPGLAYIFRNDGGQWSQIASLAAEDGSDGDHFGHAVSISGDRALVGTYRSSVGGNNPSGAAYIFEEVDGQWTEVAKLSPPDPEMDKLFGASVAVDGNLAVVGSPVSSRYAYYNGAAFVFADTGSGWSQVATLLPDGPEHIPAEFGTSVDIEDGRIVVGAYRDNEYLGLAYVFEDNGSGWEQTAKLIADDGQRSDFFGRSVSLAGNTALIGADGRNAAYVFTIPEPSTLIALLSLSATAAPLILLRRARRT